MVYSSKIYIAFILFSVCSWSGIVFYQKARRIISPIANQEAKWMKAFTIWVRSYHFDVPSQAREVISRFDQTNEPPPFPTFPSAPFRSLGLNRSFNLEVGNTVMARGEEALLLAHHPLRLSLSPNNSWRHNCLHTGKSYL